MSTTTGQPRVEGDGKGGMSDEHVIRPDWSEGPNRKTAKPVRTRVEW